MIFTEKPQTNWFHLLTTKRDKLRTQTTIPRIEAEWINAEHPTLEAYQECFNISKNTIPLTYPQILATPLHLQLFMDAQFPFPVLGIVHTRQSMKLHHPLTPSPFHIKTWIEGHQLVRTGAEFTVHTAVYQSQQLVWSAEMTILSRAVKGHGQKKAKHDAFIADPTQYEKWSFPSDLGRKYARVSGDYNPIHLHPLTAKIFGMPRHIIQGLYTVGRIASSLPRAPLEMNVTFQRPIFLPSSVELLADEKSFLVRSPKSGKNHLFGEFKLAPGRS